MESITWRHIKYVHHSRTTPQTTSSQIPDYGFDMPWRQVLNVTIPEREHFASSTWFDYRIT
ncbi:MAG: hypothetical protein PF795_02475, partial [Kiritimatiellae bacterium]|nr:hypothetical protein [Kiritimatiellia bacterium]